MQLSKRHLKEVHLVNRSILVNNDARILDYQKRVEAGISSNIYKVCISRRIEEVSNEVEVEEIANN